MAMIGEPVTDNGTMTKVLLALLVAMIALSSALAGMVLTRPAITREEYSATTQATTERFRGVERRLESLSAKVDTILVEVRKP